MYVHAMYNIYTEYIIIIFRDKGINFFPVAQNISEHLHFDRHHTCIMSDLPPKSHGIVVHHFGSSLDGQTDISVTELMTSLISLTEWQAYILDQGTGINQ